MENENPSKTSQQPIPSQEPSTIHTSSSLYKSKALLIVIGGIILIVGIALGYMIKGSNNGTKEQAIITHLSPTAVQKISPSPIVSEDTSNTNWKTYSSTFDYSFEYPSSHSLQEANVADYGNVLTGQFIVPQGDNETRDRDRIQVMLTNWPIERQISYLNYGEAGNENTAETKTEQFMGKTITKATITSSKLNYQTNEYEESPIKSYVVLIPMDKNTIRISGNMSQRELIDQVLSTFKFTK